MYDNEDNEGSDPFWDFDEIYESFTTTTPVIQKVHDEIEAPLEELFLYGIVLPLEPAVHNE